jgi:hypothetical protein
MITIIKLTSGIEVAGHAVISDNTRVVLEKPLQINYRYYIAGSPSVSFVRYNMFGTTSHVTFDRMHILGEVTAREAFANVYANQAEYYYGDHEKNIDAELANFATRMQEHDENDHLKKLLEMMPVDGAPIN